MDEPKLPALEESGDRTVTCCLGTVLALNISSRLHHGLPELTAVCRCRIPAVGHKTSYIQKALFKLYN